MNSIVWLLNIWFLPHHIALSDERYREGRGTTAQVQNGWTTWCPLQIWAPFHEIAARNGETGDSPKAPGKVLDSDLFGVPLREGNEEIIEGQNCKKRGKRGTNDRTRSNGVNLLTGISIVRSYRPNDWFLDHKTIRILQRICGPLQQIGFCLSTEEGFGRRDNRNEEGVPVLCQATPRWQWDLQGPQLGQRMQEGWPRAHSHGYERTSPKRDGRATDS